MNAVISEAIKPSKLGLGMHVLEIPAQRTFISAVVPCPL